METIKIYESALKRIRQYSKEENIEELEKQYEHIKEYIAKEELLLDSIVFGVRYIYSIIFEAKETESLTEEIEEKYLGLIETLKSKFDAIKDNDDESKLETEFDYIVINEEQEKEEIEESVTKQDEKICEVLNEIGEKNIQGYEESIYYNIDIPCFKEETLEKLRILLTQKEDTITENRTWYNVILRPVYSKAIDLIVNHLQILSEYEKMNKLQEIRSAVNETVLIINAIELNEEKVIKNNVENIREKISNINREIISSRNYPIIESDDENYNIAVNKSVKYGDPSLELELDKRFDELFGEETKVENDDVIEENDSFEALDKLLEKADEINDMYLKNFENEINGLEMDEDIEEFETKIQKHIDKFEDALKRCIDNLKDISTEVEKDIDSEIEKFQYKNRCKKDELVRTCLLKLEEILIK